MSNDDLLYRHRVQLFALAQRIGVTQACRELGFHRSTYYRWRPRLERFGPRSRLARFSAGTGAHSMSQSLPRILYL